MKNKPKANAKRWSIQFYLTYYISTLRISILATVIITMIFFMRGSSFKETLDVMLWSYPTWGLGLDFLYKWNLRRHEFFFYRNAGCSIIGLLATSFAISAIISILLHQTVNIWI